MENTLSDDNWDFLLRLLPEDWRQRAKTTGAVKRMRGFVSIEHMLRTMLLHTASGCSLRETAVLSKAAGWADVSDVALLKKLRQCESWFKSLCLGLLQDRSGALPKTNCLNFRLVDGTIIKEPGQTGSQWRIHYSLSVPSWDCDCFRLTSAKGDGNGDSLSSFSVQEKDCLIADSGFARATGIGYVCEKGGFVIVRHHPQSLPLEEVDGDRMDLIAWLRQITCAGEKASRAVYVRVGDNRRVAMRLCAVRKSQEAIVAAQQRIRARQRLNGPKLKEVTLEYANWIMVLTNVDESVLNDDAVLQWYRVRWQIELAFKRLKSLANLGHLPKRDEISSRAWLYGKLLVALLCERMQRYAGAFSPWGVIWFEEEDVLP
jgi:hypothetical protein